MDEVKTVNDIKERVIYLNDEKIVLDTKRMQFNEQTLHIFEEQSQMWCSYFGEKLADAEFDCWIKEGVYEKLYSDKYEIYKDGSTDKLAEAKATSDSEVQSAMMEHFKAKHIVKLLQYHLRAWDKASENAKSRGHFLRKEMDKLNLNIPYGGADSPEDKLEQMFGEDK